MLTSLESDGGPGRDVADPPQAKAGLRRTSNMATEIAALRRRQAAKGVS